MRGRKLNSAEGEKQVRGTSGKVLNSKLSETAKEEKKSNFSLDIINLELPAIL